MKHEVKLCHVISRYVLVFHYKLVLTHQNRKKLEVGLILGSLGYCLFLTLVSLLNKENYLLYMGMGS